MVDIKEIMLDILKRDGFINNDEYEKSLKEVRRRVREKELDINNRGVNNESKRNKI